VRREPRLPEPRRLREGPEADQRFAQAGDDLDGARRRRRGVRGRRRDAVVARPEARRWRTRRTGPAAPERTRRGGHPRGEVLMRRAAFLVLAGCSKILGINDVTLVDAGGVDTMPDAPANTVIGRSFTRCLTPAGTVDAPVDMSTTIIQALIPDAGQ